MIDVVALGELLIDFTLYADVMRRMGGPACKCPEYHHRPTGALTGR